MDKPLIWIWYISFLFYSMLVFGIWDNHESCIINLNMNRTQEAVIHGYEDPFANPQMAAAAESSNQL
jgi:hypothetical protein